ncbi:MAG: thioredoxin family protein [Thermoproteota archaeon]|nr:thioredoxin family protein [Thermoproteota archaeon]
MSEIGPPDFDDLFSRAEKSLVLFHADWCPFCQRFRPIFDSIQSNFSLFVTKLNDDDSPLWDRFSIEAVPTLIAFAGERIIGRRDARKGLGLTKDDVDSLLSELK